MADGMTGRKHRYNTEVHKVSQTVLPLYWRIELVPVV